MASLQAVASTQLRKERLRFADSLQQKVKTLNSFINPMKESKTWKIHADAGGCDRFQEFLRNQKDYKWGFVSDVESLSISKGLSEETIRIISSKKKEPQWMLDFRLSSFHKFLSMKEPTWSDNRYTPIDFQNICYYSEPKKGKKEENHLRQDFRRLGVPLNDPQARLAVSAVYDSVSLVTTHQQDLEKGGVIFCSISEAIIKYPDLVKKYLGKVVPPQDNYYAALNSAVFSDGAFCYIPKDTKCPLPISSYFRLNDQESGQFERTLIIVEERSSVDYLEGCTAPSYSTNQLHAAVVELYCAEDANIHYSTMQNWYAGDENGKGGVYNFVTKRGLCAGSRSKISWTQVESGSAITWKYPSVILEGDGSVGEFYSVAFTKNQQQADTGTKMIHKGKNTRSRIISKGVSSGNSSNCYRGLVQVLSIADNAGNFSQCDSMLIGDTTAAKTYPYIQVKNQSARIEHEASTSKISEEVIFYFEQRGIDPEKAMTSMISGFCSEVVNRLPKEFSSETSKLLLDLKLEKSVG
ncbi:UPF0051 protein in atpA 3'region-like isoform X2 [Actinidia eriantha]|nr:UPF0051 protein in atpA 3'region-like isoform X2 [Actinidia eriantha]XP_057478892.1 UPF0051 protein in atpA 3'region-like isoform X2 [Actinidia eriantha]